MRHLREGRKFNRTASHRKAMLNNLAASVLDGERIRTTVPKAKEARRVVERLITYGKRGTVDSIRRAGRRIADKTLLKKLVDDIAPAYREREGGYVRILKTNTRKGDNADMCIMELVGRTQTGERSRKAKKKATTKPASTQKPAEAAAEEAAQAPSGDESTQKKAVKPKGRAKSGTKRSSTSSEKGAAKGAEKEGKKAARGKTRKPRSSKGKKDESES